MVCVKSSHFFLAQFIKYNFFQEQLTFVMFTSIIITKKPNNQKSNLRQSQTCVNVFVLDNILKTKYWCLKLVYCTDQTITRLFHKVITKVFILCYQMMKDIGHKNSKFPPFHAVLQYFFWEYSNSLDFVQTIPPPSI